MKRKSSFLSKLLLTYLIAAIIPLNLIIAILFQLKWEAGKKEMQNTADYAAELLDVQLESIWNTMSFISLDIMSNEEFVSSAVGLTYSGNSLYEESNYYKNLVSAVSSYSYTSSSYRIVFFNEKGYYLTNESYNRKYNYTYRLPEGSLVDYDWIERARTNYGEEILLPISNAVLPNVDTEGISLVRSVRSPGKVVGYLAIQLSGESLSQLLEVGELYGIEIMILCDEDILYQSEGFPCEESVIRDADALEESLRKEYLVSAAYQTESKLRVIAAVSMKDVLFRNRDDFVLTGIVVFSVIGLTIAMIFIFAHMMSNPLILLTKKMQDTTVQNLNEDAIEMNHASFREVQILYSEFARMRQRLEIMIDNEITLMTLQTKERLSYLQAQINPHFLYNTLNSIGIMGAEVGDDRIYNSCRMLSRVLKYAITEKESAFATFEEEFQNTEMYLKLMKLRFEDKLSFAIDCDAAMKPLRTIKIILQPFVENIFEHGFDATHTELSIWIKGYVEQGTWHVSIRDDGAGMDEYALFKLKEEISQAMEKAATLGSPIEETPHIGIKNTLIRLSLFYGKDFKYSINNISSGGFLVTLEGRDCYQKED